MSQAFAIGLRVRDSSIAFGQLHDLIHFLYNYRLAVTISSSHKVKYIPSQSRSPLTQSQQPIDLPQITQTTNTSQSQRPINCFPTGKLGAASTTSNPASKHRAGIMRVPSPSQQNSSSIQDFHRRSEERRVGKECRSGWATCRE